MSKPVIQVEAHPPERGRRRPGVVLGCGCCCCCCCCLHTLGGLIGAAVAPAYGKGAASFPERYRRLIQEYEFDDDAPPPDPGSELMLRGGGTSAVAIYWWTVLVLVVVVVALSILYSQREGLGGAVLGLALGFPALQLVASLLAALILTASTRADKHAQLMQIGRMTLGMIAGTIIGILAMTCMFLPFLR